MITPIIIPSFICHYFSLFLKLKSVCLLRSELFKAIQPAKQNNNRTTVLLPLLQNTNRTTLLLSLLRGPIIVLPVIHAVLPLLCHLVNPALHLMDVRQEA